MSKAKGKKARSGSDAFQTFDQKQIQEFKECFAIMDQNKDGIIDKNDLRDLYASMGMMASDSVIDEMLKEAPSPLNFTSFLQLFGDRLTGTDPEDTIMNAFKMFDTKGAGTITEKQLLQILKNKRAEPFTDSEMEAMNQGNPPITDGVCDYVAFVKLLTTGGADQLGDA